MNCIHFARFALSVSSSTVSRAAEALRFKDTGTVGVDTLKTLFAMRVKCGSGSKHNGGAVAIYTISHSEAAIHQGSYWTRTKSRASISNAS